METCLVLARDVPGSSEHPWIFVRAMFVCSEYEKEILESSSMIIIFYYSMKVDRDQQSGCWGWKRESSKAEQCAAGRVGNRTVNRRVCGWGHKAGRYSRHPVTQPIEPPAFRQAEHGASEQQQGCRNLHGASSTAWKCFWSVAAECRDAGCSPALCKMYIPPPPKKKYMKYSGEKMLKVNGMHLALMHVHGDGDSPDIVLDVIHRHQPRDEGLIWSYVTPVSHFLFYCCTATSEPPLCGQQLSNCLPLPRWSAPWKVWRVHVCSCSIMNFPLLVSKDSCILNDRVSTF